MSRAISKRSWGPSHQEMEPPFRRGPSLVWKLVGLFALALFVHTIVDPRGGNAIAWCLEAMALGWLAKLLIMALAEGRIPIGWLSQLIAKSESHRELCWERTEARRRVKRCGLRSPGSAAAPTSASRTEWRLDPRRPRERGDGPRPTALGQDERGDDPRRAGGIGGGDRNLHEA